MPEPEHSVLELKANDLMSDWLDTPVVLDRMRRELDAIHWCFNMLRDEGELIEGEMERIRSYSAKGDLLRPERALELMAQQDQEVATWRNAHGP